MIERVYYRVKLDANTFIYTPYLLNIPTSITDIPTNVTYDTTDGITLKTKETWTYDNNEPSSVTAEREIPLKAGDGVTMDVSEDGKYVVIKVDPKRETHIGTSVPTDNYPDLFVNTADDSLSYKAPDGSWKPIAGGGSGGGSGGGTTGGKIYRHNVRMTTSAHESTLIFLSSSNVQITFDSLAQNTNGEWLSFITGTVSKTNGRYTVEKVDGMKNPYATEVYLFPVDPSDSAGLAIIIDSTTTTSFNDRVTEL